MISLMQTQLHSLSSERLALMSRAVSERARLQAALEPAEAFAAKAASLREKLFSMGPYPVYAALGSVALVLLKLKPIALGGWVARAMAAWRLYKEARRRLPRRRRSVFQR